MPLGTDALVILLASTQGEVFWIVPIATAASLIGAALTYWIGRTVGEVGLPRLVPPRYLERMKAAVQKAGAARLAAAAVLPPPFPLTPFVLTCGALDVDRGRFFLVFGTMRLMRFSAVGLLARQYGNRLRQILESVNLETGMVLVVVMALTVMIASAVMLRRRLRPVAA